MSKQERSVESLTEFYRERFLQMDKTSRRQKIKLDSHTIKQNLAFLKWLKRELTWKKAHVNSEVKKETGD